MLGSTGLVRNLPLILDYVFGKSAAEFYALNSCTNLMYLSIHSFNL